VKGLIDKVQSTQAPDRKSGADAFWDAHLLRIIELDYG